MSTGTAAAPKVPNPLFVGGTGRCGTHAISAVLNKHTLYRRVHDEVRFHADPHALPGLLSGEVTLAEYVANLRGMWWERKSSRGHRRGLVNRISREVFEPAVEAFERAFPQDPGGASARLIHALLDPIAAEQNKPFWVEQSNFNVIAAPTLLRLLPEMKVIHIVRDGRDVAASLVVQGWGPDDLDAALNFWEERLTRAERSAGELPPDRLLTMAFEDFAVRRRLRSYERLHDFIGTPWINRPLRERHMRRVFREQIRPEHANIGRWREGLTQERQDAFTERYAGALQRLIAANTPARPLLERHLAEL